MPLINHVPELIAWKFGEKNRDCTQEVAAATQLSHATVLLWSRQRQIDLIEADVLATWCQYFGVSISQLLEYVPDARPVLPSIEEDGNTNGTYHPTAAPLP